MLDFNTGAAASTSSRASSTSSYASSAGAADPDDAAVLVLLAADDPESMAQLAAWLKTHAKTFAPVVAQATEQGSGLSAQAAAAVLDALDRRAPASGEMTLSLLATCLDVIARHITESLAHDASGPTGDGDDALVGSAVAVLTSNRPSRHSETAICALANAGPGGALVLARAFDGVRSGLKLHIVQHLSPTDVMQLSDNVVVSLARSVAKLADELEPPKRKVATRFLAELGPVEYLEPSGIEATEPLQPNDRVFHASWGAGTVIATTDESATIDFGSAGTRTVLRSLAKLRRAV